MHDLANILDLVRNAVLAGDLAKLGHLTDRIERLLAHADQMPETDLEAIRTKASRNVATLNAAILGVRAAQRRLSDLREASTGHRTYGPAGQRTSVANLSSTLQQRV